MKNAVIIFALLLLCSPARIASPAAAPRAARPPGLCEIMAAPEKFTGRHIELRSDALVLYIGILLESVECKSSDVSVHFMQGYEKSSDAEAIRILSEIKRRVRQDALARQGPGVTKKLVSITVEGKLERNPNYHLEFARGDQTLMAWDYNYQFAFVVSRVASAKAREGR